MRNAPVSSFTSRFRSRRSRWTSIGSVATMAAVVAGFYMPGSTTRSASAAVTVASCPLANAVIFFSPGIRNGTPANVTTTGTAIGSACVSLEAPLLTAFTGTGAGSGTASCTSGVNVAGSLDVTWSDMTTSEMTGSIAINFNPLLGAMTATTTATVTQGRFQGAQVIAIGTGFFNPADCLLNGVTFISLGGAPSLVRL